MAGIICRNPTKAAKRYQQRMALVMTSYVLLIFGVEHYVSHFHPQGAALYAMSLMPMLPVAGIMVAVGRYLKEEVDEYKRYQLVRSMLWATGATLVLTAGSDFLRSFANTSALPPFATFVIFWLMLAVAQAVQAIRNRVSDEEPAA